MGYSPWGDIWKIRRDTSSGTAGTLWETNHWTDMPQQRVFRWMTAACFGPSSGRLPKYAARHAQADLAALQKMNPELAKDLAEVMKTGKEEDKVYGLATRIGQ